METRLMQLGTLLFLLGLLIGLAVPAMKNPRMGLSSHLEALMNGMFLVILGLIWPRIGLSHTWLTVTFWLIVYAAFANWIATLLAGAWGAGRLMPIAAGEHTSTPGRGAGDRLSADFAVGVRDHRMCADPGGAVLTCAGAQPIRRPSGPKKCSCCGSGRSRSRSPRATMLSAGTRAITCCAPTAVLAYR